MAYIGKKPADIIATSVDTTTGTFSGDLTVDTTTLYVDSANNRVGVGTVSPAKPLHIFNSGTSYVQISGNSRDLFLGQDAIGGAVFSTGAVPLYFSTDSTERMRIDSSGNLLVGTTSSSGSGDGIVLGANDQVIATRNGAAPLWLNRRSNDGDIVLFNRDGVTVGSIGARSNSIYIGLGDTGISFTSNDDAVYPVSPSGLVARDAAIDLGVDTVRFKDLYLSGGVYLGGTVAANKLDDYEEGTFDITITPETSGSITVTTGFNSLIYTKIGRIVHITGGVGLSGVSSPVGTFITIAGLPFTLPSLSENQEQVGFALYYKDDSTGIRSLLPCSYTSGTSFTATITAANIQANDAFQFDFSYVTS